MSWIARLEASLRAWREGLRRSRTLGWLGILIGLVCLPCPARAHGIVGERMFIEPLFAEDANVKNELDLPRAEFLSTPDGTFRSFGASFEKTLYPDRWSIVVEQSRLYRHAATGTIAGFDDLEVGMKVAAYRNERHEAVLTPALFVTAPTGSRKVADRQTALQPALLFAKGLGDIPMGWLRPLAFQGDAGYEASVTGVRERQVIYDFVLEYSVPYLNRFVRKADAGFDLEHNLRLGHSPRAIFGDMFPFVEFNGSTPVGSSSGASATFLRPGTLYMGKYFQFSIAADLPLRGYLPGHRIGGVFLLDLFLDEIHPAFGWTPFGKRHRHHEDHD